MDTTLIKAKKTRICSKDFANMAGNLFAGGGVVNVNGKDYVLTYSAPSKLKKCEACGEKFKHFWQSL